MVDADSDTFCVDAQKIEEKITPNTKAIIAVHIYGNPCDMDTINEIAQKHNFKVIEDAAEAHGALYKGKMCGNLSDIACFSFYANKIITTGEGGMAVTNNEALAQRMKKLRNYAFEVPRFMHNEMGFNYRLTNIQAAIGFAQAENAQKLVDARRNVGLTYDKELAGTKGIILPKQKEDTRQLNYYLTDGVLYADADEDAHA